MKGWEEIERLAPIADAYLVHDREIAVRYDDSVALVRGGRPRLIRRSRGYAPFPVALPRPLPQTLACGAELKNTFCLTRDANAFLSQHIGDLENLETLEHYETSIARVREDVPPHARGDRLRPASGVSGHQVCPRAAPTGQDRRAASPRAHRRAPRRERQGRGGDRGQHGRPGLRRRRPSVGRRGVRLRPARVSPRGSSGGAAAAGRCGGHREAVAHRARLELRAARRGRARAGGAAAAQPRRGSPSAASPTRTSPSCVGRSTPVSTRRSRRAADACSTPSPRSPACATRSPTRARRRSSSRCAPRPAASRIPTSWRATWRPPPARPLRGAADWVAAHAAGADRPAAGRRAAGAAVRGRA